MDGAPKLDRRSLVQATAEGLRGMILERAPDALIGGLTELAQRLGVGVVTLQQAARILEHDGLLEVRRGPGGGYYGKRPTAASLERSVAAYLRVDVARYQEIFEMVSLLEAELAPAAARSEDEGFRESLRTVLAQLDRTETMEEQLRFEQELYDVLFRMTDQPLMGLLGRVAVQAYRTNPASTMLLDAEGVDAWRAGRRRVLQAILKRDEDLARFEAARYRQGILERLRHVLGD